MPEHAIVVLGLVVLLSVVFNLVNGFNDAANTIATSIATRALTVPAALALAALFNFAGALISHKVAYTLATGIADTEYMDLGVITAAVSTAIAWNLTTWKYGVPSSSSHALVSALFGAALVKVVINGAGIDVFKWGMLVKIIVALFTSPLFGFAAGYILFRLIAGTAVGLFPGMAIQRGNRFFARIQVLSAGMMSFAHGSNDAQKTMGLIALALYQADAIERFHVPLWVTVICAVSISAGTMVGGMRIIKTVAKKITDLQPIHGFSAESGSALVMFVATYFGMPVSTTHVAISSVVGVGASKTFGKTPGAVVGYILNAWALTIPVTAAAAGVAYLIVIKTGTLIFSLATAPGLALFIYDSYRTRTAPAPGLH